MPDAEAWKDEPEPEYMLEPPAPLLTPEQDTMPEGTSRDNPLEIWLPKDALLEAIENSLTSIGKTRTAFDRTFEDVELTDELIHQRHKFRDWLRGFPLDHVYVALSPRQTVGLRHDEDE